MFCKGLKFGHYFISFRDLLKPKEAEQQLYKIVDRIENNDDNSVEFGSTLHSDSFWNHQDDSGWSRLNVAPDQYKVDIRQSKPS